jgi:hypothetical protein
VSHGAAARLIADFNKQRDKSQKLLATNAPKTAKKKTVPP